VGDEVLEKHLLSIWLLLMDRLMFHEWKKDVSF